jgi:hypothetical protein
MGIEETLRSAILELADAVDHKKPLDLDDNRAAGSVSRVW